MGLILYILAGIGIIAIIPTLKDTVNNFINDGVLGLLIMFVALLAFAGCVFHFGEAIKTSSIIIYYAMWGTLIPMVWMTYQSIRKIIK